LFLHDGTDAMRASVPFAFNNACRKIFSGKSFRARIDLEGAIGCHAPRFAGAKTRASGLGL
jgi:hypothetical protein